MRSMPAHNNTEWQEKVNLAKDSRLLEFPPKREQDFNSMIIKAMKKAL